MRSRVIIGAFAFGLFLTEGGIAFCQDTNNGGNAADGGSCTVTSGSNKGKTGTYTDGGTWCEGDWGGTECKDQQGNSKCSSARSHPIFPRPISTVLGAYFEATAPNATPGALKAWGEKFQARVVRKSEGSVTISFANKILTFDGSTATLASQFNH